MGKTTKVPSHAASGKDTFNDSLVGFQIVDGTSQLMNTSFTLDKVIPEKDSKSFASQPFSDFLTLDSINEERNTIIENTETINKPKKEIKFYNSKDDGSKSLFGSLKERLNVSVVNIIKKFPAAIYVDADSPISINNNSAESIVYDPISNITLFYVQVSLLYNPLDVIIRTKKGMLTTESEKDIRNFYSSYKKYVVVIDNKEYSIIDYREPNLINKIQIKVNGNCFSGATSYSSNYIIRPNNGIVEEFYQGLDDLESILLNRETKPIYQGKFRVPKESNDGSTTRIETITATWPLSRDGWNIQIIGNSYEDYIEDLKSIGDEVDNYKSNLVIRFLTSPQLYEFDTVDKKMEMGFQIYGQSFDKVKKYIDNIAFMRNVSYDRINNVPDLLLKNLSETLGFSAINLLDEKSLDKSLYERHKSQYDGIGLGQNLVEAEYEFYRRLLVNLAYLYKSKGTRDCIEFFLKFIGAPEPMIVFDEYLYEVTNSLPNTYENDIADLLLGVKYNYTTQWDPITSGYTLTTTTGSTTLTRDEYPVDENGYPRGFASSDGDVFFEKGTGWYRSTLDHRGPDVLDTDNSILTGNTKTIKTKGKTFTYGEDYFDNFRKLPGLDYGYEINRIVDNKKTMNVLSIEQQKKILNRKNISIFISADRAALYDIYTKGRDYGINFGNLEPQTGITFAEFADQVLMKIVDNSHTIKFKKQYTELTDIYVNYMNSVGFTPYNYIKLNQFIEKLSPYWTSILDQFIPATTQWIGGNLIRNNIFNRSKYKYIKPCVPLEIILNLYPDFDNIIKEDLETILGGGTINGVEHAVENLRGLFTFKDMVFNLYLRVNSQMYSGTTDVLKNELFNGFVPTAQCTSLETTTDSIPLICDYKDWLNIEIQQIKIIWKAKFEELIASVIADYNINVEYFIDNNGVEKVKFTTYGNSNDCVESVNFFFDPNYTVDKTECDLRVEIFTLRNIYSGTILQTCISDDVYIAIINENNNNNDGRGGFNVGIEKNNIWDVNFYISSGSTCSPDPCTNCNLDEMNVNPISYTNTACIYYIPNVKETDVYDIIVSDAANCEQKIRINGLKTECLNLGATKGYVIYPSLQYKTSYNHGIKKGTVTFKLTDTEQQLTINSWEELETLITNGTIVSELIENINIGDKLLSIEPIPSSLLTTQMYKNVFTTGAKFAFEYNIISVDNIDCFSSIKKDIINGVYEVLPTTKLFTYTNLNEFHKKVPYHFRFKYPEDLHIKPTMPVSCCEDSENGDYLIDQDGFLIEVISVDLNYCDRGIYYNLNTSGNNYGSSIIMNGPNNLINKKIITHSQMEMFKCLDMMLIDQFEDNICIGERDNCAICDMSEQINTIFMHIPNIKP